MKTAVCKQEFNNCTLVYVPKLLKSIYPNFRRLLEILEVDINKLLPIYNPTHFKKIILPDEAFGAIGINGQYGFTSEYRNTIDCVRNFALKNRTPTSSKKIYYFHGTSTGEERLAEYFRSKGYEIIQPEKLTLDEQLNLLINAESFVATCGSISHNSFFLRDGTEAIFIPRAPYDSLTYQLIVNSVNPMNEKFIDSSLSLFRTANKRICYVISKQLRQFFGDKWNGYEENDFKIFLQYVKNMTSKKIAVEPIAKNHYGDILANFMSQLKQCEDLITAYDMPKNWDKELKTSLNYQTHIHTKGWVAWQNEEQISGSTEDKLDIQAIKINFPGHKVYYSVYYNDKEGWSEEVTNGEQAGTTGKSKAIFGIRIRLDEAGTKEFNILYRVHKFDGNWTDWAKNGEVIYSHGQKLNAIQIKLEKHS